MIVCHLGNGNYDDEFENVFIETGSEVESKTFNEMLKISVEFFLAGIDYFCNEIHEHLNLAVIMRDKFEPTFLRILPSRMRLLSLLERIFVI